MGAGTGSPPASSRQFPAFALDASGAHRCPGRRRPACWTHAWYFRQLEARYLRGGTVPGAGRRDQFSAPSAGARRLPGDARLRLLPPPDQGREAVVEVAGRTLRFASLFSGEYDQHQPLLFIHHTVGVVGFPAGATVLSVYPCFVRRAKSSLAPRRAGTGSLGSARELNLVTRRERGADGRLALHHVDDARARGHIRGSSGARGRRSPIRRRHSRPPPRPKCWGRRRGFSGQLTIH